MKGEVLFFLVMDGYGFLRGEDGTEYFVHRSAVPGTDERRKLEKGQLVGFDLGKYRGRTVATNVRLVEVAPAPSTSTPTVPSGGDGGAK